MTSKNKNLGEEGIMVQNFLEEARTLLTAAVRLAAGNNFSGCKEHLRKATKDLTTAGELRIAEYCEQVEGYLEKGDTVGIAASIDSTLQSLNDTIRRRQAEKARNAPQVRSVTEYKCTNARCKKLVPDDAKFCTQCGVQQIRTICPNPDCHALVPAGLPNCPECSMKV